MKAYAVIQNQL